MVARFRIDVVLFSLVVLTSLSPLPAQDSKTLKVGSELKNAETCPKTWMTLPKKLLVCENFASAPRLAEKLSREPETWSDGWRVKNGTWATVDECIRGIVLHKIYPAATLHFPISYQNAIVVVDVRLDDIPLDVSPKDSRLSAAIVFREADASHIASVRLSRNGFKAAKDKTHGREIDGVRIEDDEVPFGNHELSIKPGSWYTVLIEISGTEMLASLNGESQIWGSHPVVGLRKGVISFGTSQSASFRNLRLYEAELNPNWEPEKAAIVPTAPTVDRVGFPENYRETFERISITNRAKKQQLVTVYANALAASVQRESDLPYPNGSVFVMETADTVKGSDNEPLIDSDGFYQRSNVTGLHVMRREKGFGQVYAANRTGEWEYVEYVADGSYITPPQKSASCAECHVKAGADRDWVYRGRFPLKEVKK